MRFDADAVHRLMAMLEPGAPSPGEAERLAAQVGSWPEMLAHLLLRRDTLARYPEIADTLRAHAERYRGGQLNRRPRVGTSADIQRLERSEASLEMALSAVLASERARVDVTAAADVAVRDYVMARPRSGFDLHHRMVPEPK